MNVSIIIPNWNGREKLERNLPEVLQVKNVDEIIVVDDASTDDSVAFIKENYSGKVKILEKKINTGFGSNVNMGVKHAKGDLIFLVNSDAAPEPDCLKNILPHFVDPRVFSVGCNTGGNWSWARWKNGFFWHYQTPLKKDEKPKTHETLWASGGSGVFRKDVWEKLGGFDPMYDPFYVEDLDLGYRAKKRGFINIWETNAHVDHYKQVGVIAQNFSSNRIANTSERNMLIFTWKNITDQKMLQEHIKGLIKRLLFHPKYWLIFFAAVKNLDEIKKRRQVEIKNAFIPDQEILQKYS